MNKQKAEEYAASKTKDIGYQKELTDAVLYGIELAKQESNDYFAKRMEEKLKKVEPPTPPIQQGKTTESCSP